LRKDINLNLYKVFYYVAITNSFKAAAEQLFVSQPAISKQIKNLEDILGVKLFYRYTKGVELTNEGKLLLEQIEKVNFYLEVSEKCINSSKVLDSGELIIGCQSHIVSFYLLDIIEKFRHDYPGITIKIISDSTSELLDALHHHQIDFIIDNFPLTKTPEGLVIEDIAMYDTIFICSNDYDKQVNGVKDLNNVDLILPLSRSSIRKSLERALATYDVNCKSVIDLDTTDLIISSVKKNMGIGYVIKEAVKKELNTGELREIKLDCTLPKFDLKLLYNSEYLSFPAIEFIGRYIRKN